MMLTDSHNFLSVGIVNPNGIMILLLLLVYPAIQISSLATCFDQYFINRWSGALKRNADNKRRASHLRGPSSQNQSVPLISIRRNRCLQRRYPYPVKWTFCRNIKHFNTRLSHVVWGTGIWRYWIYIFPFDLPIFNTSSMVWYFPNVYGSSTAIETFVVENTIWKTLHDFEK